MKVRFHKSFTKDLRHLDKKINKAFMGRMEIFLKNPYHVKLNNHPLHGRWFGYRSINITGDFRAVYKQVNENNVIFVTCGTHSKLYR